MRCYIFSRSLPEGERDGAIFVREEPKGFVEELRKKKGKDIWLIGGGELTREFLKEDLVDELYLGIVPVLIGKEIRCSRRGFRSGNSHVRGEQNLFRRPDCAEV